MSFSPPHLPTPPAPSTRQVNPLHLEAAPQVHPQWQGRPYPLGATWTGNGVNFAIFSAHATAVELCLFDDLGEEETARVTITERSDQVWHVFLPEVKPGQLYGYRVHGPYEPQNGHRFNPNKLLLDPYGRSVAGDMEWDDSMFGYKIGDAQGDLSFDERDNAKLMPKSVVVDPAFTWGDDRSPNRPLNETVIYETHVKGFSKLWAAVPEVLGGTYAGLACPQAIHYFQHLGVTAIELMPVHHFVDSRHLVEKGLADYWGYNTLAFFAPEARYSSTGDRGEQVSEFKSMVRSLHAAGIEVILDVVYNHTVEGSHLGPTLSFRGIDNASYYRLVPDNRRYYMDYTGTGNTLNIPEPRVLQMMMDSLRYWVTEMHVDGFRFDLASTLARELHEVKKLGAFFDVIHQDPVVSRVKLIAEPWDLGEGGYQVGNFPLLWAEWNGRYRDTIRRYWKGDPGLMRDFAYRLCGSADLYEANARTPSASINFVTAHDGFALRDLYSFNEKRNHQNGEENRDGESNNNSWNCGHEGLEAPEEVLALRRRMQRNLLATLLLSQGVPMLRGGDERSLSQQGNNNAYCQDNELTWQSWEVTPDAEAMLAFTRKLIEFRTEHVVFHRPHFFQGRSLRGDGIKDITWYNPDGTEMSEESWSADYARSIGLMLCGDSIDLRDYFGVPLHDDTFLLYFNSHHEDLVLTLPSSPSTEWQLLMDTSLEESFSPTESSFKGRSKVTLPSRSVLLFIQRSGSDAEARESVPPSTTQT